ncbi:unnamed protein product [Rotaria sp. Silwood1]|nr:unnamed protein product [Rotaria sp. Silwood1]
MKSPALILWGRQDKVYAVSGVEFFRNLLPNSECVIFDDCGHFMAIDKPEETTRKKKKKELLTSAEQLTRHVLDGLNNDVSECYKNQKRIDHACKQLTSQSNLLLKQSQAWITLIGQFTDALKELGDVENYSKIIERECLSITNILANVHQDMTQNRQQTNDTNPQDSLNPSE